MSGLERLKTRPPTGCVPWPLILVEGAEKSGKSWVSATLSASDKVGQTYWIDLGEGAADEYGAIPGVRYLVVEHDGTWPNIMAAVEALKVEAQRAVAAGEPPVVLVIDSMTAEWDLLKDWAIERARGSWANQKRLREDPGAEVKASINLWNDANARHRRLMSILMTFPGVVVMTARGKEVAAIDNGGRPIEGSREYKVEGHKTLAYDASVWVRMTRDHAPLVVSARSVHAGIQPGKDKPRPVNNFSLEWLIFDLLKCDPEKAHVRNLVATKADDAASANSLRDAALESGKTADELLELYQQAQADGLLRVIVVDEHGDQVPLGDVIVRLGKTVKHSSHV